MFSVMDPMNNLDGNEQATPIGGPYGAQLASHDDSFDHDSYNTNAADPYPSTDPYANAYTHADSYVQTGSYGAPVAAEYVSNPVYNHNDQTGISIPGHNYQNVQSYQGYGMSHDTQNVAPNYDSTSAMTSSGSVANDTYDASVAQGIPPPSAAPIPHAPHDQAELPLAPSGSSSIYSLTPMNYELYQNPSVPEYYDSLSSSSSFFEGLPNYNNATYANYKLNNSSYNTSTNATYNNASYTNPNHNHNHNASAYSSPAVQLSHTVNYDISQQQPSDVAKYSRRNSYKRPSLANLASPATPVSSSPRHSHHKNSRKRYRVIRGTSAGGATTRPPKVSPDNDSTFLPVVLDLRGAGVKDICYPQWSDLEKEDRRRIIRIERTQIGPKLVVNFSIVGSANQHPTTLPPPEGVDVLEVSCLECVKPEPGYDSSSDDDSTQSPNHFSNENYQYFITSVEVVEIVEMLIGTQLHDPADRRRERGRVRSNLVPFWLKRPISSRMNDSSNPSSSSSNTSLHIPDTRADLAKRIMAYEIRKPRGFDKEVRILRWDKLVPALKRALQSYYTEIPRSDAYIDFD